jgi:hypothetical protein
MYVRYTTYDCGIPRAASAKRYLGAGLSEDSMCFWIMRRHGFGAHDRYRDRECFLLAAMTCTTMH